MLRFRNAGQLVATRLGLIRESTTKIKTKRVSWKFPVDDDDDKQPEINVGGKSKGLDALIKGGFSVPKYVYVHSDVITDDYIARTIATYFPTTTYFAVRSSASCEDGEKSSNAGQFYTGLAVTRENAYAEACKVRDSYNGDVGTIIIQEFVTGDKNDKAGVMFTNAGAGIVSINSNFGICDTVVKGDGCDEFLLSNRGKVIKKKIVKKVPQFFDINTKKIKNGDETSESSLTDNELKVLFDTAKKIESYFGAPQDVEFCFYRGELYLLQTRPITRKIFDKVEYFDGANIQESFNGIVLPLTFTLAQVCFPFAYKQALINVGVDAEHLEKHKSVFDNLLTIYHGHMYYNMNNWYKMAKFVPGTGKEDFETMITSNVKEDVQTEIEPIGKIKFFFCAAYEYIMMKPRIKSLISDAKKMFKEFSERNVNEMSYEDCIKLLKVYQDQFTNRWYLIGENDFCVMTCFGKLKKKFTDEQIAGLLWIESASTRQVEDFRKVVEKIKEIPDLWQFVVDKNKDGFYDELKKHKNTNQAFKDYFCTYGGRFANELKLETLDITDDFDNLSNMMLSYQEVKENKRHVKRDDSLPNNVSLFDRFIINRFKAHATNRENLRLIRSNFFGVLRKIFTRIGVILEETDIIEDARDVFYLDFDIIYSRNTLEEYRRHQIYKNVVKRKKSEYKEYKEVKVPSSFHAINGNFPDLIRYDSLEQKSIFTGSGSSSGVVTGRVKVFKNFYIPDQKDSFDILVAKNTDPGWTNLIGMSKGMIIENGGIMAHAAIVSRELGIPTVINVENALEYFKDGDVVEVNGSKGIIKLISREN